MQAVILGVIIVILVGIYLFSVARGRDQDGWAGGGILLSHLKCPKCGTEFDYAYVPGASFTSVRLGRSRLAGCPRCHKWSVFDLHSTRVDPATHHCSLRIGPG